MHVLKKVCCVVLFLFAAAAVWAAGPEGAIAGRVVDSGGNAVAGALVQVSGPLLHEPRGAATDASGRFRFEGLPAGASYDVKVSPVGMNPVVRKNIRVRAGATVMLPFTVAAGATEVTVTAAPPDINQKRTETGSSVYRITPMIIQTLPEGRSTPLNQVVLQAPGVVQDSYGQLHVRGDHGDLQYRINGILLPEGISGFGQTLSTRFAESIDLVTGALPAQYGDRTAGVVEIETRSGAVAGGGSADLYGGARGTFEPSVTSGGSKGSFFYFATASCLESDLGVESPTPGPDPMHDHTRQAKGFGYFSWILNPDNRLSVILGTADSGFEIPNVPGQSPAFRYGGLDPAELASRYPSSSLDETQQETNHYGIVAWQGNPNGRTGFQLALFSRYSSVNYHPDPIGDLIYNGVAASVFRSSFGNGLQGDLAFRLNPHHTLRWGFFAGADHARSDNTSAVFPADALGNQTSDAPLTIVDNHVKTGWLYGAYMQDEWHPTGRLTVNFGLRADGMDAYIRAGQISPRAGLVWKVTPKVTLHAGYARYFTPPPLELIAPTSIEKFKDTTNALPTDADTNVKAERSHYFDVGVVFEPVAGLSLGLDGYVKRVTDLLDEGQFGQALVFSPFNYAKGRISGIEITTHLRRGGWTAYLNAACSSAKGKEVVSGQFNFDAEELAYIASHDVHLDHDQTWTGSGGVSYRWTKTSVSVNALYGSGLRRGFANTLSLPAYMQVNLGATRSVTLRRGRALEFRLSVLNVFDRVYEIRDGTGIGVGAPQYGPRRARYAGVHWEL
ncbi:MAG: TonB-dependent receptor [Acidobacteriota bacterium]